MERIFPQATIEEIEKYSHDSREDVTYWSTFEAPFCKLQRIDLATSIIAEQLGVRVEDVNNYIEKLDTVFKLDDLIGMDEMLEVKEKFEITAEVDGVIVEGSKPDHHEQIAANETKASKQMEKVIKKTKKMRLPNEVRFADPPKGEATTKEKKAAPLRNVCRFDKEKKPCPYGKKCKFYHAPVSKDRVPAESTSK